MKSLHLNPIEFVLNRDQNSKHLTGPPFGLGPDPGLGPSHNGLGELPIGLRPMKEGRAHARALSLEVRGNKKHSIT